jgi:MFS family permease
MQLDGRSLPRTWWSYLVERTKDSRGYVLLTLLASSSVIMLGAVWGAVPTPFAAYLAETHELSKLGWLLAGQFVALAIGACYILAARNVVGFPDRVVPTSRQARAFSLALALLVILAGSLVTLGLPFLQAPWWLAVSLASYTLAGAMWGLLLPRLRPGIGTQLFAHRHVMLREGVHLPDTVQLAHRLAQETLLTRQFTIMEGILIAFLTPILGWLIDLYGSSDRVLILVGLCFLLGLTVLALIWVMQSLKYPQPRQVARSTYKKSTPRSWKPASSPVRLAW